MTNTTDTYTHKAVCAVCFAIHFLNPARGGENPIRHGFHVVGGSGQGHSGSWHTGPCAGVSFRHFGVSTDGTKWALAQIIAQVQGVQKLIAGLEARPNLSWSYQPKKYQAATWQVRKSSYVPDGPAIERTLTPGTEEEVITYPAADHYTGKLEVKAPSYERELAMRLADANSSLKNLLREQAQYETAIKTWKPAAPVPAKTLKVVHLALSSERYPGTVFADCNRRIRAYGSNPANMTTDKTLVTCQRCKKA